MLNAAERNIAKWFLFQIDRLMTLKRENKSFVPQARCQQI